MLAPEQKVIKIIQKVLPAVVSIAAYKNIKEIEKKNPQWLFPFFEKDVPEIDTLRRKTVGKNIHFGGGSGFIVDSSGIVVTNAHVIVRDHLNYEITASNQEKFPAKLVAADVINDIAFLKIKTDTKLPFLSLGNSSKVVLGQSVLAVGNALGLFQNTVSSGIISGLLRSIEANNEMVQENLHGLIQTDAAINPGNSGGPLIDTNGYAIGINAASVMQAENIGFAIPINIIKRDLEQIKKNGKITYPFLGVRYMMVDEKIRELFRLPVEYGALVASPTFGQDAIIKNSPAYRAGVRENDVIIEVDGHRLTARYTLQDFLESAKIGQKAILKIIRKNKESSFTVALEERK